MLITTILGKIIIYLIVPTYKVAGPFGNVVLLDHVTN